MRGESLGTTEWSGRGGKEQEAEAGCSNPQAQYRSYFEVKH